MINLLAMFQHRGIGFFGQEGFVWAFIGLIFMVVLIAICFKIFRLVMPALGVPEPWVSVLYWVFVLLCVLAFMNYSFGHWV